MALRRTPEGNANIDPRPIRRGVAAAAGGRGAFPGSGAGTAAAHP